MNVLNCAEDRRHALRHMMRGRAFDMAMCRHNPHWHESRGEEGVYIGAFVGLRADDVVAPHFRGACGLSLMRGADPYLLATSVFGKAEGTSRGAWRGDICPTPSSRFLGMFSGALGASVAYAVGAALQLHLSKSDGVAVCAFGDGTLNAGIVYESMNLAAMLRLPVVFVCQNNQYATSLSASVAVAGGSIAARARALGISAVDVDGNDICAVAEATQAGVVHARQAGGPAFVHAQTYRLGGHFMNDPEVYRSKDEVRAAQVLDPLDRLIDDLIARDELDRTHAELQLAELVAEMDAVVGDAKAAAEAPGESLGCTPWAEDLRAVTA